MFTNLKLIYLMLVGIYGASIGPEPSNELSSCRNDLVMMESKLEVSNRKIELIEYNVDKLNQVKDAARDDFNECRHKAFEEKLNQMSIGSELQGELRQLRSQVDANSNFQALRTEFRSTIDKLQGTVDKLVDDKAKQEKEEVLADLNAARKNATESTRRIAELTESLAKEQSEHKKTIQETNEKAKLLKQTEADEARLAVEKAQLQAQVDSLKQQIESATEKPCPSNFSSSSILGHLLLSVILIAFALFV